MQNFVDQMALHKESQKIWGGIWVEECGVVYPINSPPHSIITGKIWSVCVIPCKLT